MGYEPNKNNRRIISKTAYLSSWYAPGLSRAYALTYKDGEYRLDLDRIIEGLVKSGTGVWPVRIIGFPSYTYFLLEEMKQRDIICRLPKGSRLLLGGGWKQFAGDEIPKGSLYKLVEDVLGVEDSHIHEFFSAAEHPVLYCSCKRHNFHVPVYGKVIIRDVNTLEPLPKGQIGLVNLLTPLGSNLPLMSIMTDDLGILHDGTECGCGIPTDYLEILGRVGVRDIKTCAVGADDYLKDGEV